MYQPRESFSVGIVIGPGSDFWRFNRDAIIADTRFHGPTVNEPSSQYIHQTSSPLVRLTQNDYAIGVDPSLSVNYPISDNTGVLSLNTSTQGELAPLKAIPRVSRDRRKGGLLNDQHLFIFSDTGSYTSPANLSQEGTFLGFVGSSVATAGNEGLVSESITLKDGIGEWSDDVRRKRGFVPLTRGEESYNMQMQSQGQRYAVWPESSIIPLDRNNAILYSPIIYDDVNMDTQAAAFTYAGTSLLTITAGNLGGPSAQRSAKRIFNEDEVEWVCAGGIRSWGAMGPGGTDGRVYLFGNIKSGLLFARVNATDVTSRDSHEYWTGSGWNSEMPGADSTALIIEGSFIGIDIFYSSRYSTFIVVYMTTYVGNTFYYRYLKTPTAIIPKHAGGDFGRDSDVDYVENIVHNRWSDSMILYKANPGASGKSVYSGSVHQGYYDNDDISNGGSRMLLSWTAPTGQDAGSTLSEYQIMTGEVQWA